MTSPSILLVDDEPGMLRYIRTLLEVDSYKVETANNGQDALQRVQAGLNPDLVLLDLLMPGIDGLQTLEQLRRLLSRLTDLPCVGEVRQSGLMAGIELVRDRSTAGHTLACIRAEE